MATAMLGSLAQGAYREAASVGVIVTVMQTITSGRVSGPLKAPS